MFSPVQIRLPGKQIYAPCRPCSQGCRHYQWTLRYQIIHFIFLVRDMWGRELDTMLTTHHLSKTIQKMYEAKAKWIRTKMSNNEIIHSNRNRSIFSWSTYLVVPRGMVARHNFGLKRINKGATSRMPYSCLFGGCLQLVFLLCYCFGNQWFNVSFFLKGSQQIRDPTTDVLRLHP